MDALPLGTPGVYALSVASRRPRVGISMDVCAFVGIAPRGPARAPQIDEQWSPDRPCVEPERPLRHSVAVPIESWNEYRAVFGGFEGPGLLPYAVAAFFEQGGRRAYVVRVLHCDPDPADPLRAIARGTLRARKGQDGLLLRARSEGSWGNRLAARLTFRARPVGQHRLLIGEGETGLSLLVAQGALATGALLRIGDGFAFVEAIADRLDDVFGWATLASLRAEVPPPSAADTLRIDEITATLSIWDGSPEAPLERPSDAEARERPERARLRPGRPPAAPALAPTEIHDDLGLHPRHPRWLAQVLCYQSNLAYPVGPWANTPLLPRIEGAPLSPDLVPLATDLEQDRFQLGEDRYGEVRRADLVPDLGVDDLGAGALAGLLDLTMVVVTDLFGGAPLPRQERIDERPSRFIERLPDLRPRQDTEVTLELEGLRFDAESPGDLADVVRAQRRLVAMAEGNGWIALLDVPPGLPPAAVTRWRGEFSSSHAAAYHPFLLCSRDDDWRVGQVAIGPAAVAAGIIAATELRHGIGVGPANVLCQSVTGVVTQINPAWQTTLHRSDVNLFLTEPRGVRLIAARTLSLDNRLRQLSARRVLLMVRRAVEYHTLWATFEPNTAELRSRLGSSLSSLLASMHRGGAFAGRGEGDAYLVRCDEGLNPQESVDAGRLVAELAVAPSEPLEFVLLRLSREADGGLMLEERR